MGAEWLTDFSWGFSTLECLWRASWQGAPWAALVWGLSHAVPRMPSALRAGLWWLVSLKFVLSLGALSPVQLPLLPTLIPGRVESMGPEENVATPDTMALMGDGVPWRHGGAAVLLVAWGLGIAWQLKGHVRAWSRMRRLRLRAMPLRQPDIEKAISELASAAGLRRVPCLLMSDEMASPLATGLISPVIVLPAQAVRCLDLESVRMAVAHELAHFQRRDLWFGWVPALAESVLFFHPLVRKTAQEYALAREEACDAEALRLTGAAPGDYGQLLLTFGVTRTHGTAAVLGASTHIHTLHRRLSMLEHVDVSTPRRRTSLRVALLLLGLAVLLPVQLVAREQTASPRARSDSAAPEVATPAVVATKVSAAPIPSAPPAAPSLNPAPVPSAPSLPWSPDDALWSPDGPDRC
ncbi:M56 family metallopeptidase [Myxococcus sp. CA051A]|uniref:M56 family metallopeptidase n=1 Tax=unclassified Myxococcus TaxID=2648731 RepID=UPI00157ABD2A|nr:MULTISPECIES: M56 family metallopeptidase [unclassified Myxococcus]NTX04446.1 M56 family metallopeptidase [Myxococcus sp. CA040A]NTX17018.1 M56 family metallopeptidase [Myxococcus sp. CA056]NTX63532.1 M56 family metallopeptidase [Myxococcus sp. CA051A]